MPHDIRFSASVVSTSKRAARSARRVSWWEAIAAV
jgi:hypothetical protein